MMLATFYETLAAQYTKLYPQGQLADPEMAANWVSVANYFGEGSTWNGDVLTLIRPTIQALEKLPGGDARISGTGYPGRNYRLLGSTNLVAWILVTNQAAFSNGNFVFVDAAGASTAAKFYRVSTP